jgi:hypothetical protein
MSHFSAFRPGSRPAENHPNPTFKLIDYQRKPRPSPRDSLGADSFVEAQLWIAETTLAHVLAHRP